MSNVKPSCYVEWNGIRFFFCSSCRGMWCNSWRYGHGKWPKLKQKKVLFDATKDNLPNTVTKSIAVSGSLNRCRWYIIPQLAVYTTYIPLIFANWVIICYLPPIKGARKLHWLNVTSPSVVPILFRVCFVLLSMSFLHKNHGKTPVFIGDKLQNVVPTYIVWEVSHLSHEENPLALIEILRV